MDTKQNTSTPSEDQELAKITKQLYEHNVELSIRNRTLVLMKDMYDIINQTVGMEQTAQELLDAIVNKLNFQMGMILLMNRRSRNLTTIAFSQLLMNKTEEKKEIPVNVFKKFKVSTKTKSDNYCINAAVTMRRRMTNSLVDVATPLLDEKQSSEIQTALHIQTFLIDPIIFGRRSLGTIVFGMDKHVGALSRAERDALRAITNVVAIALEQTKTFSDLKSANKRLKELDSLKDEFVSIASHELRTPMTAIKSYLWMAINKSPKELNAELKKYLEISYASTERLIRLVNDMLTVSRIERNKVELKLAPIKIHEILSLIYEELKVTAEEKKIEFKLLLCESGDTANVDKDKMREVYQNLIGNALKFTPPGGKITIQMVCDKSKVKVSVIDTGSGIPKEEMSKLFKKFSKIDYSYAHHSSQPGTGLGLYISKQIVSLHGGDIQVESTVGTGSTFSVILPVYQEKGGA